LGIHRRSYNPVKRGLVLANDITSPVKQVSSIDVVMVVGRELIVSRVPVRMKVRYFVQSKRENL
jgi:hypothetical protein